MSDTAFVSQVKTCDICVHIDKSEHPRAAAHDTKTVHGSWANICEDHYKLWAATPRHGTGFGQRLVYPEGALAQFNAEREVALQLGGRVI